MKILRITLLSATVLTVLSTTAQTTFKQGGLTYKVLDEKRVEVSAADDKDDSGNPITTYAIPSTIDHDGVSYTVTAIGEDAFYWNDVIAEITLPQTVDTIRYGAFRRATALTTVSLPAKLRYIGDYAFNSTGITSIDIPATVKTIGESCFFTCSKLTNVTLHEGLEEIGSSAFYKCPITSISVPATVDSIPTATFYACSGLASISLGNGVRFIGDRAFRESGITAIDLPATVQHIGEDAFLKCTNLTSLTIPAMTSEIGRNFIANTGITTLSVDAANSAFHIVDGALYSADNRILYAIPTKGTTSISVNANCVGIYGGAFSGSDIEKVVLPEGLRAIDDYAFTESKLKDINLPASLVAYGVQAFAGTALTTVTLPENATSVSNAAFAQCLQLEKVTIPSDVSYIANRAFYGCNAIKEITCLGTKAPELEEVYDGDESPFVGIDTSTPLYVPKGTSSSYQEAGYADYLSITETDKGVFAYTSTTPQNGGQVEASNAHPMAFDVVFAEPVNIVTESPKAFLYKGNELTGTLIVPDLEWKANKGDNNNTLRVWGSDYDGFQNTFKVEDKQTYTMIIPASTVANAAGEYNERIVITFTGHAVNAVDKVQTSSNAHETARYTVSGIHARGEKGLVIKKMSDGTVVKEIVTR